MDANAMRVILAWAAFGVFHSLTVSEGYERLARKVLGDRGFAVYHRLLFTIYTSAAILLLVLYLRSLPDSPLYRLEGVPRLLFHLVQAAGAAFLLWTPWDLLDFVGIRQWMRRRDPGASGSAPPRLFTGKAYGIVRHPLYLGISAILLFSPVHTRNSFLSAATAVAYFYAGTFLEERRLVRSFGEAYREYRERVPRIVPSPRRRMRKP